MDPLASRCKEFAKHVSELRARYAEFLATIPSENEAAAARGQAIFLEAEDRLRRLLDTDLDRGANNILREVKESVRDRNLHLKEQMLEFDRFEEHAASNLTTLTTAGTEIRRLLQNILDRTDDELYQSLTSNRDLRQLLHVTDDEIIKMTNSHPQKRKLILEYARRFGQFEIFRQENRDSNAVMDNTLLRLELATARMAVNSLWRILARFIRGLRWLDAARWTLPALLLLIAVLSALPSTVQLRPESVLTLTAVTFIAQRWIDKGVQDWHRVLLRKKLPEIILQPFVLDWTGIKVGGSPTEPAKGGNARPMEKPVTEQEQEFHAIGESRWAPSGDNKRDKSIQDDPGESRGHDSRAPEA